jgi:SAM-dependent methyltransferase
MFFQDRIKSIGQDDSVLEIGPGSAPFHRSNVLLEKKYETEEESAAQFGHTEKLVTDKKIVYYSGERFPFADNEFDYVICSHVLEHVEDPEMFISEIFRVARKGYFEYPLIYYEYLYNFNVHLNFVKFDGKVLNYMKKSDSPLDRFQPVQSFYYQTLQKGHVRLIDDLLPLMMEGFEWKNKFEVRRTTDISLLVHREFEIPSPSTSPAPSTRSLIKQLLRKVIPV